MLIEVFNEDEMLELGERVAKSSKPFDIFSLDGELGVGKTVFTKGFAKGLGICEDITSPTFSIVNTYQGENLHLNHFDVYRIKRIEELEEIGFFEYLDNPKAVTLIEWASQIEEVLPKGVVEISIKKDLARGEKFRLVSILGGEYEDSRN